MLWGYFRARAGPSECSLLDKVTSQEYPLTKSSISCMPSGSYIGDHKPLVYISGKYGTSVTQTKALYVSATDGLYSFQSYPGTYRSKRDDLYCNKLLSFL